MLTVRFLAVHNEVVSLGKALHPRGNVPVLTERLLNVNIFGIGIANEQFGDFKSCTTEEDHVDSSHALGMKGLNTKCNASHNKMDLVWGGSSNGLPILISQGP